MALPPALSSTGIQEQETQGVHTHGWVSAALACFLMPDVHTPY